MFAVSPAPRVGVVVGPPARARGDERVWTARFGEATATVALAVGDGEVRARAWGEAADAAMACVPGLVGLLDDPSAFDAGPVLRPHLRGAELRFGKTTRIWPSLLSAILGQRVTGRAAGASGKSLARRYGDLAPGPFLDLWLPARPDRIALATYPELHGHNLDRRRAELIVALARRHGRLQALTERPVDEAMAALATIPGVGPWSRAHVAREVWGDADAVPIGDYHLPHHVAYALAGEPRATDDRMLELLEPWKGHRGRAIRLILQLPAPPRRGPRGDDPDIRAW